MKNKELFSNTQTALLAYADYEYYHRSTHLVTPHLTLEDWLNVEAAKETIPCRCPVCNRLPNFDYFASYWIVKCSQHDDNSSYWLEAKGNTVRAAVAAWNKAFEAQNASSI